MTSVAWPIPLLARVMRTTLSLILGIKFCFETRSFPPLSRCASSQFYLLSRSFHSLHSTFYYPLSHFSSGRLFFGKYRARISKVAANI
jgi:hypothetical protein